MRIALGIEYDGSAFCGWQSQPHCDAVQDALERAVERIAGHPVRLVCAGRTDTGVHALGQVAHFDTDADRPDSAWVRGVNAHLPDSVAVNWACQVDDSFHARYLACRRRYRYLLLNRSTRPALRSRQVGWFHLPLDEVRMQAAANLLLGEHDFSAFRAAECQARSPVKVIYEATVRRAGEMITFDFVANAFLHHMVRNMVGSLVYVGKGSQPVEWILELIASRDRAKAAPTFSPAGLYLVAVDYPSPWSFPAPSLIMPELLLA